MPYKLRPRRRMIRRKRLSRKSKMSIVPYRSSLMGSIIPRYHYFKRTCQLENVSPNAGFSLKFKLEQLPNYTEFTNLFDEYKINAVSIKLVPAGNIVDQNNIGSNFYQHNVWTAIDVSGDGNAPTSLNEILQYENVRSTPSTRIVKRYCRPKIASYNSGSAPAVNPQPGGWIATERYNELYYSIIGWIPEYTTGFEVFATFYLAFRTTK